MKIKIIVFFIVFLLLLQSYSSNIPKNDKIVESTDTKDNKKTLTVNLLKNQEILNLDLEDYIIGVVSCEMPASFDNEALKAMAVAARTFALYKMKGKKTYDLTSTTKDQCYIDKFEMYSKWGKNYEKYYNIIKKAVNDTKGEYLTYNGDVIISFYFSISNGYTEPCEHVFSQKLDYLVSVDSSWDKNYSYKQSTIEFDIKDFFKRLNIKDKKINKININRYKTNRVKNIKINSYSFNGTKFRKLLNLKSTDFTIEYNDKKVIISTKGYGHGVGMSQYGAQSMAKVGYKYDEILKYYYKGVKLVNN